MTHAITTHVVLDGDRNTIIKVNIKGDGSSGELTKQILYDASAYAVASTDNRLDRIMYTLNGFSAELFWAATADVPLLTLENDISEDIDFSWMGGTVNNAGTGKTGDILITTNGLASSTKDAYIILLIKQKGVIKSK